MLSLNSLIEFKLLYRLDISNINRHYFFVDISQFVNMDELPRFIDFSKCVTQEGKYFCPNSPGRKYKNKRNLKRHIKEISFSSKTCHLCGTYTNDRTGMLLHLHSVHANTFSVHTNTFSVVTNTFNVNANTFNN